MVSFLAIQEEVFCAETGVGFHLQFTILQRWEENRSQGGHFYGLGSGGKASKHKHCMLSYSSIKQCYKHNT